jgi:hypothetical protein
MINTITSLQTNKDILFLRTPMIFIRRDQEVNNTKKLLINAFIAV